MGRLGNICLVTSLMVGTTYAQDDTSQKRDRIPSVKKAIANVGKNQIKDISTVEQFKHMFSDGKISGQIRAMYAGYDKKESGEKNTYATAVGGGLKYELASLYGFNGAVAFRTSQDIGFITGDRDDEKQNDELSSSKGSYTDMSEVYLNYKYQNLNLRVGRQLLDTPLADSDDIRMVPNTFEAYVLSYDFKNISFMLGNIQNWQGYDAGLDNGWISSGAYGTTFCGVAYDDKFIEGSAWYYNSTENANAFYTDLGINYHFNKNYSIHGALQYLNERELSNSGYGADIYGGLVEFVAYDIGFNIAYDKAEKRKGKHSFSGTGGGTMFTSMDTMIIDEIADDREVDSIVGGLSYDIGDFSLLYAYGDFAGGKNSDGEKAHIAEQDMGFEYNINDEFVAAAIYVMQEDKENAIKRENDWNRLQVMLNYNF